MEGHLNSAGVISSC
jgi:hypothetical protein